MLFQRDKYLDFSNSASYFSAFRWIETLCSALLLLFYTDEEFRLNTLFLWVFLCRVFECSLCEDKWVSVTACLQAICNGVTGSMSQELQNYVLRIYYVLGVLLVLKW